ncbi:TPA: hypothetical protein RJ119_005160 [Bacillus cereus]|nr:hypothetical protein [Bacillus cereus]
MDATLAWNGIILKLLPPIVTRYIFEYFHASPIFGNERTGLVYKKKVAIYIISRLRNIGDQLFILLTVW